MIAWPTDQMTFVDWAASLRQLRPDIDINPIIFDEDGWQEWAARMIQSAVCQTVSAPRPEGFPSWADWAKAFIHAFGNSA